MEVPISVKPSLGTEMIHDNPFGKKMRKVWNKESPIWITAAKIEEVKGNTMLVGEIIESGIKGFERKELENDREFWIKEAEFAEEAGFVATCRAIISNTLEIGVKEENRKQTWIADAEECEKQGSIETARAIYARALNILSTEKCIWLKAAQLEKNHGSSDSLYALLCLGVTYTPKADALWMMRAKEKWLASRDVLAVRAILEDAYTAAPDSEEIWLAAFQLEYENNDLGRARKILAKARVYCVSARILMKSAIVERELGNEAEERELLSLGVNHFNSFFKLWLMLGQLEERSGQLVQAKQVYELGIEHCRNCVPLWISLSNVVKRLFGLSEACYVLTLAMAINPKNTQLWIALIRENARAEGGMWYTANWGNLMRKALEVFPDSGVIWAAAIDLGWGGKKTRKRAWKKYRNDPHMMAAMVRKNSDYTSYSRRNILNEAVRLAPDIGDHWGALLKFEMEYGSDDQQEDVLRRCVAAQPKHGEIWQTVSKAVENSHQPAESILKKVVALLVQQENSDKLGYKKKP